MKKMIMLYALILSLTNCSEREPILESKVGQEKGHGIVGTWQLYETGTSVGGGSISTTSIPAVPLQTLTFTAQGDLVKEGNRLGDYFNYPAYQIDSTKIKYQMVFLANRKDTTGYKVNLSIEKDNMTITPFCVEGCYLKFVRTK